MGAEERIVAYQYFHIKINIINQKQSPGYHTHPKGPKITYRHILTPHSSVFHRQWVEWTSLIPPWNGLFTATSSSTRPSMVIIKSRLNFTRMSKAVQKSENVMRSSTSSSSTIESGKYNLLSPIVCQWWVGRFHFPPSTLVSFTKEKPPYQQHHRRMWSRWRRRTRISASVKGSWPPRPTNYYVNVVPNGRDNSRRDQQDVLVVFFCESFCHQAHFKTLLRKLNSDHTQLRST